MIRVVLNSIRRPSVGYNVNAEDLREAVNKIAPLPQIAAEFAPTGANWVQQSRTKKKRPNSLKNSQPIRTRLWSGRLDLNQRPLAPQSDSVHSAGLAPGGTGTQALDIIGIVDRADPSNGIDATPDQRPFVPPVSPRRVELPDQLLTVREVARRLRVCPATVYKICAAGELVHVRISNAIRVAPDNLDQFIAVHRAK